MSKKKETILRIIIMIGLLAMVWLNAHWSVAVILTLIGFRFEWDNRGYEFK